MDRSPAVAGMFYPAEPGRLRRYIEELFLEHPFGPKKAPRGDKSTIALVEPHAGYMYSGPCAAHGYTKLREVDTIIIAGPNHTGFGEPISVRPDGKRITPLGELEVDLELASRLNDHSIARRDYEAHIEEHSIEVQLPFIQYVYEYNSREMPKILPIALMNQQPHAMLELARGIIEASESLGREILFIASSDLNHYEPQPITEAKDLSLLQCIEALDIECLYERIAELNISACGPGGIAIAISLAKRAKASAKVLSHYTSGDITGDKRAVVGYASVWMG